MSPIAEEVKLQAHMLMLGWRVEAKEFHHNESHIWFMVLLLRAMHILVNHKHFMKLFANLAITIIERVLVRQVEVSDSINKYWMILSLLVRKKKHFS